MSKKTFNSFVSRFGATPDGYHPKNGIRCLYVYTDNSKKRQPRGLVMSFTDKDNRTYVGWSLCNRKHDNFTKHSARIMAASRMVEIPKELSEISDIPTLKNGNIMTSMHRSLAYVSILNDVPEVIRKFCAEYKPKRTQKPKAIEKQETPGEQKFVYPPRLWYPSNPSEAEQKMKEEMEQQWSNLEIVEEAGKKEIRNSKVSNFLSLRSNDLLSKLALMSLGVIIGLTVLFIIQKFLGR